MEMDPFPEFFYSRAPLPHKVNVLKLKDKFYWELSVQDYSARETPPATLAPYEDNDRELIDCCELDENFEINPTKSGKYITSFYVPPLLHSVIIGPRGSKLRELQDNTTTLIKVPKPDEEGLVKITGPSERSVASARTQIALLILSKREKLSISHFVSIPVISGEIRANFGKFRDAVLGGPATRGVDETIFQRVDRFHLTIVTAALLDEKEISEAKACFQKCGEQIREKLSSKRSRIVLKGVEIMNDDPSEVDVLYGKVELGSREETQRLQEAADDLLETFSRNGFVRRQSSSVKLHVTLMNSLFRRNDGYQQNQKGAKRESFDATYILDKYRDFYFGSTMLDQVHLSVRFTTSKTGYYEPASVIKI